VADTERRTDPAGLRMATLPRWSRAAPVRAKSCNEIDMSKVSPAWTEKNLANHHAKRIRENPGCFEDLLGITVRFVTDGEYRERSV
jgi:hypothetical protein